MLHILSSIVLGFIVAGLWARRHRPDLHVRLMTAAFVCDVLLVLYIEGTRHAVEKVAGGGTSLIWFHATISVLVLVAYVAQIALGRQLLAGIRASRRVHILLGITFVSLRLVNYVTSFMV